MSEVSAPPPGMIKTLLLRLLLVAVLLSAVIGVWWIFTGEISPGGGRLFLNGLGIGMFGAFGLGAQQAGKRSPSFFSRIGPVAALLGGLLWLTGVWLDAWESIIWWRSFGVSFFVSFAGLRGAMIAAAPVTTRGAMFQRMALLSVTLTMALGVLMSTTGIGDLGWRLFGVGAILEMASVVCVLVMRASPEDRAQEEQKSEEKSDPPPPA